MKKRNEVLAILAAAAGLSFVPVAQASVMRHLELGVQAKAAEQVLPALQQNLGLTDDRVLADETLSRMIQLASAMGFEKSGNANAAGSPTKSPQGNENAQGYSNSQNPNAAGSPSKPTQGSGNNPS